MSKVLILEGGVRALPSLQPFLKTRGFEVTTVQKIQEAVQFIAAERPEFTLLPAELVPLKCAQLSVVLSQLTNVVLCFDRVTAKTLTISREFKDAHTLEAPFNSSAVESIFRKIERSRRVGADAVAHLHKAHVAIMATLSDLALKAICAPGSKPGAGAENIPRASRVTCFRAHTKNLSGYFVIAYGQNRSVDPAWTARLQDEIRQYVATFEEHPLLEPGLEIEIVEVNFHKWTKEQADFLSYASHQDNEIALAFFRDTAPMDVRDSAHPGHCEIGIENIRGDAVTDFDIYIYLPQNARFVLYTPRGGTFYESQKRKLISDGIQSVHVNKKSLDEVRRQRSKKFIEEKSAGFANA